MVRIQVVLGPVRLPFVLLVGSALISPVFAESKKTWITACSL